MNNFGCSGDYVQCYIFVLKYALGTTPFCPYMSILLRKPLKRTIAMAGEHFAHSPINLKCVIIPVIRRSRTDEDFTHSLLKYIFLKYTPLPFLAHLPFGIIHLQEPKLGHTPFVPLNSAHGYRNILHLCHTKLKIIQQFN